MFTLEAYDLEITSAQLHLPDVIADEIAKLPSAMYLLANGFRQSIGDAGAVMEKDIPVGMSKEDFIADKRQQRLQAILQGKVGLANRGPRLRGIEAIEFELVVEKILKPLFTKAQKSWPSGKGSAEDIRGRVAEYWAKPRTSHGEIKKEAKKIFEAQAKSLATEEDLSDLV